MFAKRVISAIVLITLLILSVYFHRGPAAVCALVMGNLIALVAAREYFHMLQAKGMRVAAGYGCVATVVLVSTAFFESYCGAKGDGIEYAVMAVLVTGLFVLQAFSRESGGALTNIAGVLSGLIYVGWLWSFIYKVVYFPGRNGRAFVFALFLIVKGGDMLAYVVGSFFGRHKLIPRISPGKTWEGAIGNLAGGMIAGLIVWRWFPCGIPAASALALGAVLSVIGQIGDLAESMLKRDAALKDSGGFIPGIGGVLDVIDSLLLTLPILYLYLYFTR